MWFGDSCEKKFEYVACSIVATVTSSPCVSIDILPFIDLLLGQFVRECKCRCSAPQTTPLQIHELNSNIDFQGVSLSKEFDEVVYKREQPLIWREESKNATLNEVVPPNCRNSVQGKVLIVDDEGYVCPRIELLSTGCCKLTPLLKQYDCDSCIDDGCCSVYEHCVSCCLNPNKVSENWIGSQFLSIMN